MAEALALRDTPRPDVVYVDESPYSYIGVTADPNQPNIRQIALDRLIHSRVNLNDPRDLRYEYEWVYSGAIGKYYPEGKPITALVIGGGGYAYPHYLEVTRPGSRIDVAEIDSAVTEAAHAACGLPRDTSIHIFNMDARNFTDDRIRPSRNGQTLARYDCIFGDSINDYSVPYHLTTREFNERLNALLADAGLYLFNLIDILDSGRFLGAVVNTCRTVFPYVYVFSSRDDPATRDTFVVVNAKRPLDMADVPATLRDLYPYGGELLTDAEMERLREHSRNIVLTDDFAPVDNMLAPVVKTSQESYPISLIEAANALIAEGDLDAAMANARLVLRSGVRTADAYEIIGTALLKKGDLSGAVEAWNRAVTIKPDFASARELLASAYWKAQDYDNAWKQVHTLQAAGKPVAPDFLEALMRDSGRTE
jgi:spermidine synthase